MSSLSRYLKQFPPGSPAGFKRRFKKGRATIMRSFFRPILCGLAAGVIFATLPMLAGAAQAQTKKQSKAQAAAEQTASDEKPNIMFIMGDDIGFMQPSIYHRGLMVGETPNIDRIGNEGAIFMDYLAMQSCTSGRNAFFTGMYPLRTGMIPPQPILFAARHPGARQIPP
jgi:hypothetical protein